jgi:catechol 2,3-dioxygenase-like lactoylglutathione lyase family enzyme
MVRLTDPNGFPLKVVHGVEETPALPTQTPLTWNVGPERPRTNATQRPPLAPARIERLGHVVIASRIFLRSLDWYLQHLGLIVSDFLFLEGQRERGPVMAFIRCDRGLEPADHHTLAMVFKPDAGYVHSAFEVADMDALAAGGEYLGQRGYTRSWGVGRHIQGSQVFDYWRDPDKVMIEHYADGDLFDHTLEPGWAPMSASGLAQWGPRATGDFLGSPLSPSMIRSAPGRVAGGQRDRRRPPPGLDQGAVEVSIDVLRTADGWWVERFGRAARIDITATTTAARPPRLSRGHRGSRQAHRKPRPRRDGRRGVCGGRVAGHDALPGRRPDGQLPGARAGVRL